MVRWVLRATFCFSYTKLLVCTGHLYTSFSCLDKDDLSAWSGGVVNPSFNPSCFEGVRCADSLAQKIWNRKTVLCEDVKFSAWSYEATPACWHFLHILSTRQLNCCSKLLEYTLHDYTEWYWMIDSSHWTLRFCQQKVAKKDLVLYTYTCATRFFKKLSQNKGAT